MLFEQIERHARRRPSVDAVCFEGASASYAEFIERIERMACALELSGADGGTRIASCCANSFECLALLYAVGRIGGCVATLDPAHTDYEIDQICRDFRPHVYVGDPDQQARLEKIASHTTEGAAVLDLSRLADAGVAGRGARSTQSGSYLVQYTSGSTGKPKGVLQSQRGLARRVQNWADTAALEPGLRHLCILPLSHGYGNYCVALPALASGGSLHMFALDRVTPQRVLRYIEEHRIDCFYALPFFYQLMARTPRSLSVDLSGLRLAMVGSAPLPIETEAAVTRRFGIRLHNTYGTSEAGIITSNLYEDGDAPAGTIGKLIRGMEAQPIPEEGSGELIVRTDGMAEGYFSPQDGPMLEDGWSRTGDVVRRDAAGRYFVVGRVSQFINVSGNKVSPLEIEDVIHQLAGVHEVAVIGVDDQRTTQKVAAFVVAEPEALTEDALRAHCRSRLAEFKVPTYVFFRADLPKNPVGKVMKSQLSLPDEASRQGGR